MSILLSSAHSLTKIYTIQAIAEEADKILFRKMMSANHCIHFLLPSVKSTTYYLRPIGHPWLFLCLYFYVVIFPCFILSVCITACTFVTCLSNINQSTPHSLRRL